MQKLIDQYGQPLNTITFADRDQTISKLKKMVVDLVQTTKTLTQKDISHWRQAWRMAIAVDNPKRLELYSVYTDTNIDNHLSGAIAQVNHAVKQRGFKLVDRKTKKEKPELTELLEADWFKDFMQWVLDARYWGHSLIELGDVVKTPAGTIKLSYTSLIPREHVVPEFGVILRELGDDIADGIPYREGKLAAWVIEAGAPKDLGLFLKLAPHAISKKNMLAFWDQFGELFGHPIRIAKTSNPDPKERSRVENMLTQMGSAAWGLFPEGTEIEIKETSRADAFEVYDRRIIRANSEMSKAVLTQTMTIDDGSSLSQGQIHEKMFKATVEAEADRVRDLVNNQLIPKLITLGFPFSDSDIFEWEYALEYSPEELTAVEANVLQHYDVDPNYWVDRYGIPVTGKKEVQPRNFNLSKDQLDFFV